MAKPTRRWWLLQRESGPGCTTTDRPGTCKEQLDAGRRDCPQCGSPARTLWAHPLSAVLPLNTKDKEVHVMWAAVTIKGHTAFFQPEQPARLLVHTPRPQVVRRSSHLCESRQGFLTALHTALWAVSKVTGVLSCAVNKGRGTGWTLAPPLLASVRAAAHLVGTWVQSRFLEAGCLGGWGHRGEGCLCVWCTWNFAVSRAA